MSLGLTLVIVVGEIDLSFGAMYGLGANVLAVLWIMHGVPVYLALVARASRAGALVGLVNGAAGDAGCRIPSFIVTLGSYNLLYGISLWITHTSTFNPVYPPPGAVSPACRARLLHRPHRQLRLASDLAGGGLDAGPGRGRRLARCTARCSDSACMAIGGNPVAARLARLPVTRYKILAFVLSGVLAAIAGILDFSFIQTVQPNSGLSSSPSRCSRRSSSAAPALPAARAPSSAPWAARCSSPSCSKAWPCSPRAARPAALPRRRHDRRGRPRPRSHQHPQAPRRHERRRGGRHPASARPAQALWQHHRARTASTSTSVPARCSALRVRTAPARARSSASSPARRARTAASSLSTAAPWSPIGDWHAVAVVHQEPQLFPNLTVARERARRSRGNADAAGRASAPPMPPSWMRSSIGHLADKLARRLHARHPAAHRDRARDRPRRPHLPLRRAELGPDRRGIRASSSARCTSSPATGRIVLLVTHRLGDLVAHCRPRRDHPRRPRAHDHGAAAI